MSIFMVNVFFFHDYLDNMMFIYFMLNFFYVVNKFKL